MGFASGMETTVEHLSRSFIERENRTKILRDATRQLAQRFRDSRAMLSAGLRDALSVERDVLRTETRDLVTGYMNARHAIAVRERTVRASQIAALRQETAAVLQAADDLVKSLGKSRREMGRVLRDGLARDRETARDEAMNLMATYKDRRGSMAQTLWRTLGEHMRAIRDETDGILGGFREMRRKNEADLREAARIWRGWAGRSKTAETVVAVPQASVAETEGGSNGEGASLTDKALAVIRDNPDGLSLAQVGEIIGVHPVALSRSMKNLVDENLVRKEERSYFPVNT